MATKTSNTGNVIDKFTMGAAKTLGFFAERWVKFFAVSIGLVVIAATVGGLSYWQNRKQEKATDLVLQATNILRQPLKKPGVTETPEQEKALGVDPTVARYETFVERTKAALIVLESFDKKYANTKVAPTAHLLTASCYMELGRKKEATELYRQLVSDKNTSSTIMLMSQRALAFLNEDDNKVDEAIKRYQEEALKTTEVFKPMFDLLQAETYFRSGDKNKAVAIYKKLLENLENQKMAMFTKIWVSKQELEARIAN